MLSKTSYITWDTVVPDTLTNTYLKLHWAGILACHDYGPSSLLVTILYTKCFFLISVCVTTKLKRVMKNWRGVNALLSTTSHFPSTIHSDSNHVYTPMWPRVKFTFFFFCSRLYSAIAAIIQTVDLKRIECVRAEGGFCYASKGGYKKRSEYFIQKLDYVLSTRFVSSFGVLEGTTNFHVFQLC